MKKILILILCLAMTMLSVSCNIQSKLDQTDESFSTPPDSIAEMTPIVTTPDATIPIETNSAESTPAGTEPIETTPAETTPVIDIPPFSESLASPADVKRVGIKMGGVIVEGQEKLYGYSKTSEYNTYVTLDWAYTRNCEELLSTSAAVRYSPDYEVIVNLENVYHRENGEKFVECIFYTYTQPKNGSNAYYGIVSEPLTEPGVYLMEVIVGVWSPWLAEMEPERAPQLPPKQPNTIYPESYAYYFTVIVE